MDDLTYVITELPIGRWTQDYKQILTEMLLPEKRAPLIADFKENHTDTTVHFTILLTPEQAESIKRQDLYKFFKLETTITTNNFNLFSPTGQITHYDSAQHIVEEFFAFRLPYFQQRKDYLISKLGQEIKRTSNMARFVVEVVEGKLIINNRPQKAILRDLEARGYDTFYPEKKQKSSTIGDVVIAQESNQLDENDVGPLDVSVKQLAQGYSYLLSMKLWSLTKELVESLKKKVRSLEEQMKSLKNTTPEMMWDKDLDAFLEQLMEMEKQRIKEKMWEQKKQKKPSKKRKKPASRRSDAGLLEVMSDVDDFDDSVADPRKERMTAKEKAFDQLKQKTNDVTSRFSISDYYKSQLKEPTPEMLKELNAVVDEETGEVVRVKKERKARGTSKKVNVKEEPSMILESDSESDSEDDVIRDNRAAIAAKKMEEDHEPVQEDAVDLEEGGEMELESNEPANDESVKVTKKRAPAHRAPAKSKAMKQGVQTAQEEEPKKPAARKRAQPRKAAASKESTKDLDNSAKNGSEDSEEDGYVPLAERLKRSMKDDVHAENIDELANTKSTVPRKRRAVKRAEAPRKRSKVAKDSDSSDSLFGF